MAVRDVTLIFPEEGNIAIATWVDLDSAGSDTGKPVNMASYPEKSVQAKGANTNTVALEGSNDGTNFTALGSGLTLTVGASGYSPVTRIPENPLYIRPASPSAANIQVIVVGVRR